MPYFPLSTEVQPYQCRCCKGWFTPSNVSCTVMHPSGSCCHKYESPAQPPMRNVGMQPIGLKKD